jgi:hypothetical protein
MRKKDGLQPSTPLPPSTPVIETPPPMPDWVQVRGERLAELLHQLDLPIRFVGNVSIPELEAAVQTELLAKLLHKASR